MKILFVATGVFLACAFSLHAQNTVFVVRHAEKAAPTGAAEKDPDLSPAGSARAAALAEMLRDAQITAIFATEYKRTQQTAEPLARALQIEMTVHPASDTAALVTQVKEARGNALVVGHSNTVPAILQALGAEDPVNIGDNDYDNVFVVTNGTSPRVLRLHLPCAETTVRP